MCAYNAIYGIPACASPINNAITRGEWGWDGVSTLSLGVLDLLRRD
eukprot:COSAG03_NODE_814_length_5756_cov_5.017324_9_plen_46_part_00